MTDQEIERADKSAAIFQSAFNSTIRQLTLPFVLTDEIMQIERRYKELHEIYVKGDETKLSELQALASQWGVAAVVSDMSRRKQEAKPAADDAPIQTQSEEEKQTDFFSQLIPNLKPNKKG